MSKRNPIFTDYVFSLGYDIISKINNRVYLVYDRREASIDTEQKEYILKFVIKNPTSKSGLNASQQLEIANILGNLTAKIISVHQVIINDKYEYDMMVIEYIGESLEDRNLPVNRSALNSVLDKFHELGVAHGDVHLKNIIPNNDNTVYRLIDLETARMEDNPDFESYVEEDYNIESSGPNVVFDDEDPNKYKYMQGDYGTDTDSDDESE